MNLWASSRRRVERRGSILVPALMVVGLVFVLAVGVIQFSTTSGKTSAVAVDRKNAFYLAEAGLADSYAGLCVGKTGNIGTSDLPAAIGDGIFWAESTDLGDDRFELECTAIYGRASVTLGLVTERIEEPIEELGLHSVNGFRLDPGTYVDSYDSSQGTYVEQSTAGLNLDEAVVSSSGAILLDERTTVRGSLAHGIGSTATVHPTASVSGAVGPQARAPVWPAIEPPAVAAAPDITLGSTETLVIPPGEYGMTSVRLASGSDAVITGPATLVVQDFVSESSSRLTLDTRGGEVDLYVTGTLDLRAGSVLEMLTEDPQDVTVQIGSGESTLAAASEFYGQVYAPSSALLIGSSFELFGGVVAQDLALAPGARLHMDIAEYASRESRLPRMLSWRVVDIPDAVAGSQYGPWLALGLDRGDLLLPSQAHEDQWLSLSYVDLSGVPQTYDGMESGFDWTQVSDVTELSRDGRVVDPVPGDGSGTDPGTGTDGEPPATDPSVPVDEMIDDPDALSSDLMDALLDASPLTNDQMRRAMERVPPMSSGDLRAVLSSNSPLPASIEKDAVDCGALNDADLSALLIENSPLPNSVLNRLTDRNPPMNATDLSAVLAAQ